MRGAAVAVTLLLGACAKHATSAPAADIWRPPPPTSATPSA